MNTFNLEKRQYIQHYRFDTGFKDTLVNRILTFLHGMLPPMYLILGEYR